MDNLFVGLRAATYLTETAKHTTEANTMNNPLDLRQDTHFFWFRKEYGMSCPEIATLADCIASIYAAETGKQPKYIRAIIANCYFAWLYDRAVAFFSKNEYWAKYNKDIKDRRAKFSATAFRAELKCLSTNGLISITKGKAVDGRPDLCMASRMEPTAHLTRNFKATWASSMEFNTDVIRIRESKESASITLTEYTRKRELDADAEVYARAEFLRLYNEFLRTKHCTYDDVVCNYLWNTRTKTTTKALHTGEVRFIPQLSASYSGTWDMGGRLYARSVFGMADYQQLPKSKRKSIRINGDATVELDYSCLHLSLLYAMRGLQLCKDAYAWCADRKLAKKITLIAINTGSIRSAVLAILKWADESGYVMSKDTVYTHLNAMMAYHAEIRDLFMSDKHTAVRLQHLDSNIMCEVLKACRKRNIVALPVHDSVIVQQKYANTVANVLKQKYFEFTGFQIEVK